MQIRVLGLGFRDLRFRVKGVGRPGHAQGFKPYGRFPIEFKDAKVGRSPRNMGGVALITFSGLGFWVLLREPQCF